MSLEEGAKRPAAGNLLFLIYRSITTGTRPAPELARRISIPVEDAVPTNGRPDTLPPLGFGFPFIERFCFLVFVLFFWVFPASTSIALDPPLKRGKALKATSAVVFLMRFAFAGSWRTACPWRSASQSPPQCRSELAPGRPDPGWSHRD